MSEFEQSIIQLAAKNNNPDEFVAILEKLPLQPNEKGAIFFQAGVTLYGRSYFILALYTWNKALAYFVNAGDRSGEADCYRHLGNACYNLGDFTHAIELYEKSLLIVKDIGDRLNEANCITNTGSIYRILGNYKKALELYDQALLIVKELKDRSGEGGCYMNLGNVYGCLGDFRKAIEYHEQSLLIEREIGERPSESKCYGNIGIAYANLGDFRKAIEYHEQSLLIEKELENRSGEAACYANLGIAYLGLGDFKCAIELYEKALQIVKETGEKVIESKCYQHLGVAYNNLSDFRKAIEYSEQSMTISKELGDKPGEAACYAIIGSACVGLGDFVKAIEYHEKALLLAKELGDRSGVATCYVNLGSAYHNISDFRKALELYEQALQIVKDIGVKPNEANCYMNLGNVYYSLADFRKAIEYHEHSLLIFKDIEDMSGEANCYMNLGNDYYSLADFRKATEYYEQSLQIKSKLGDRLVEVRGYSNIGIIYYCQGDFEKAIEFHEKALRAAKELGDRSGEALCYMNLGIVYDNLDNFTHAIELYEQSLLIFKEIGYRSGEAKGYTNLGHVYTRLGDFGKATKQFELALQIARELGEIEVERVISLNLAGLNYEFNPQLAYDYCRRSIELSEIVGGKLVEEQQKTGFQAQASNAYQLMVPICLKIGNREKAFEYAESSKSRAFLELLAATKIKPTVELTNELKLLLDEEENSLADLRAIQTRNLNPTNTPVELGKVDSILEKLSLIYKKISTIDPEYVSARRAKPLSFIDIQDMLSAQKKNIVLLEYFTTDKETFIFVVCSKDKELHVITVPLPEEKISRYVDDFEREVINYNGFGGLGSTWIELSKYLIEPVSKFLTEKDLIYFIPYGQLHYLPLHALELNGEPLIKKYTVAYAPSASSLKFCLDKGTNNRESCVSFGLDFENEARKVAELFRTELFTTNAATKQAVYANVDKNIMHFSCHGKFDVADPLSSGIKLYDGILSAREIFGMKLNTELVTLSACQTGINERSKGDELIGLTRALLYAGAPSVVVSLWSVDAESTQELMFEFYLGLKSGMDKASALQQAQKKIMEKYPETYYWAPFILIGQPS